MNIWIIINTQAGEENYDKKDDGEKENFYGLPQLKNISLPHCWCSYKRQVTDSLV